MRITLLDCVIVAILLLTGSWLVAGAVALIAALPSFFPAFFEAWRTYGLTVYEDGKFVWRFSKWA